MRQEGGAASKGGGKGKGRGFVSTAAPTLFTSAPLVVHHRQSSPLSAIRKVNGQEVEVEVCLQNRTTTTTAAMANDDGGKGVAVSREGRMRTHCQFQYRCAERRMTRCDSRNHLHKTGVSKATADDGRVLTAVLCPYWCSSECQRGEEEKLRKHDVSGRKRETKEWRGQIGGLGQSGLSLVFYSTASLRND
jgi:hypothetical protein